MKWLHTLLRLVFGDWRHVSAVAAALAMAWLVTQSGHPAFAGASAATVLLSATVWLA